MAKLWSKSESGNQWRHDKPTSKKHFVLVQGLVLQLLRKRPEFDIKMFHNNVTFLK